MLETKEHFGRRLTHLGRKHRAMAHGYSTHIRSDGLIVVKPRRRSARVPLGGLVLVALGFFCFKAFLVMTMGDVTYTERVDSLRSGTAVERSGGWAMQIDPVTERIIALYAELSG